jgi:hypothetical protein
MMASLMSDGHAVLERLQRSLKCCTCVHSQVRYPDTTRCSLSGRAPVLPWSHDRCTSEVEVMTTQSRTDAPLHAAVKTHLYKHVVVHI